MKRYIGLYAILIAIFITGILLYLKIPETVQKLEVDYVAVNEITKQSALFWNELTQLDQINFIYRFTIIDNNGVVRYASDEGLPDNLPTAIKRGFTPVDVTIGTSVVGKALIESSPNDAEKEMQARMVNTVLFAFVLLCVLNFAFLLLMHNVLVKPFKMMQSFAHKITTGRLDEPLPMDKNNIFGLFTQSFDVMRDSLLEARKNQIQAERVKKELIASLNHDVKTPVTSIRLITELLQAKIADPSITEKLKTIEIKADQIDRLMSDMLHSAMEELGELTITLSSEASDVLITLFKDADYLSKIRMNKIPACLIEFDRVRMEQVIGNIITNSYKYAGTDIDVDFKICGELLQVDINDYGKGIEPEELELITTKFYRGENAKASPKEGEGLGLYIAKLLMHKMGGGLETFNRDEGFTVRIWLRLPR